MLVMSKMDTPKPATTVFSSIYLEESIHHTYDDIDAKLSVGKELSSSDISTIIVRAMQFVSNAKELTTGVQRKEVVLSIYDQTIRESGFSEDDKKGYLNYGRKVIESFIDVMINLDRGRINIRGYSKREESMGNCCMFGGRKLYRLLKKLCCCCPCLFK